MKAVDALEAQQAVIDAAKLISNMTILEDGEVDPCHIVYFVELQEALAKLDDSTQCDAD